MAKRKVKDEPCQAVYCGNLATFNERCWKEFSAYLKSQGYWIEETDTGYNVHGKAEVMRTVCSMTVSDPSQPVIFMTMAEPDGQQRGVGVGPKQEVVDHLIAWTTVYGFSTVTAAEKQKEFAEGCT